jgi:hypothetical protein
MNRKQRRAAQRARRRVVDDLSLALSKPTLVQVVAELAAADPTISGATIIMPDGEMVFLDAAALRGGGRA